MGACSARLSHEGNAPGYLRQHRLHPPFGFDEELSQSPQKTQFLRLLGSPDVRSCCFTLAFEPAHAEQLIEK